MRECCHAKLGLLASGGYEQFDGPNRQGIHYGFDRFHYCDKCSDNASNMTTMSGNVERGREQCATTDKGHCLCSGGMTTATNWLGSGGWDKPYLHI